MNDLPRDETAEQSDGEDKYIAKFCTTDRAFSPKQQAQVKKASE
jgi:hypothetical protein